MWFNKLVNKQLQNTYCPISHEVKGARQWNLVRWKNRTGEFFFFKNHAEDETGRLVPDLFLFFRKVLYIWAKSKYSAAYFLYISIALNVVYNKNKQCKILDHWSRDMLNFDLLEKGLGKVSPPHFVYGFLRKIFLMLYFINWSNFISWLPLLL